MLGLTTNWVTWLRTSWLRRPSVLVLDGALGALSLWAAVMLRFEGQVPEKYRIILPVLLVLVAARILSSWLLRLHRWSFLLSGLTDGARIGIAGLLGTGLFVSALYLLRLPIPPRGVVVMELLLATVLMTILRFSPRLAWMYRADLARARRNGSVRALILGAGAAGEMLQRDLRRSDEHSYHVVGFVDDDPSKVGSIVGGKPVLGSVEDLRELAQRHRISKILIAVPRLPAERIREILSLCADLHLRFKILPVSYVYLQERAPSSMLQDLSLEDLLHRETVSFTGGASEAKGRSALVTGAAGSIGSEICRQLLRGGVGHLAMVDIDENGLYLLQRRLAREFPEAHVEADLADIREPERIRGLFESYRPQDVFHAAAHKQVPMMEGAPCEAVKNNVLGTLNVVRAAELVASERFIFISTDKAVRPSSIMGATKRVGEMLTRWAGARSTTRFVGVRFGNVLGSAGSVVPIFKEQIEEGGPVTVTHPDVRRYFMTIGEAVGLVLQAAYGDYGPLCILEMGEQIRIVDLARHLITLSGYAPEAEIPIVFTGLRPGEKLSEELLTEEEEETHSVAEKISVAEPPGPGPGFERRLDELIRAAVHEDPEKTLELLRRLVPSFRCHFDGRGRSPEPSRLAVVRSFPRPEGEHVRLGS